MSKKTIIRIILNFAIAAIFTGVAINAFVGRDIGMLTAKGIALLRYFTTISNLFGAVMGLIWAIITLVKKGGPVPRAVAVLKYIACTELFLTFSTVAFFLAPVFGIERTCLGNNFWMHFIVPLSAVAEQIFLSDDRMGLKENFLVMIPPFLYGSVYTANNLINGTGVYPMTNDWYGFLSWGLPVGIAIFAGVCVMSFLCGLALRGLWKAVHRRQLQQNI